MEECPTRSPGCSETGAEAETETELLIQGYCNKANKHKE